MYRFSGKLRVRTQTAGRAESGAKGIDIRPTTMSLNNVINNQKTRLRKKNGEVRLSKMGLNLATQSSVHRNALNRLIFQRFDLTTDDIREYNFA
jgi:hypothetical protein